MWKLHHPGVGEGQRQRRADAARGANRTKQVGVLIALVGGLDWPRPPARPLSDQFILLANPCLAPRLRGGKLWNQISILRLRITP
jgi:hypothetical protein